MLATAYVYIGIGTYISNKTIPENVYILQKLLHKD